MGLAGRMEGGFVWVVISGPSWEPLIIRKSNKQGNPVFHTQPWPRLSVCVFPLRLPTGLLSHTGMLGGNFPSYTLAGWFCALGPARQGNTPGGSPLQTKISAELGRCRASVGRQRTLLALSQQDTGLGDRGRGVPGAPSLRGRRVCHMPPP